ncbi:MAG: hypothetical protein OEV42_03330 [Deltaproteobacteria bacterium]|nr:hypothetical protein [Deltaproteobacteria bacterium]
MCQKNIDGHLVKWKWKHKLGQDEKYTSGKPKKTLNLIQVKYYNSQTNCVQVGSQKLIFGVEVNIPKGLRSKIINIGFTNTIYSSERFYYHLNKEKIVQKITDVPAYDDIDDDFWYAKTEASDLDFDEMGWTSDIYDFNDAPWTGPYENTPKSKLCNIYGSQTKLSPKPTLFFIDGIDSYECFLILELKGKKYALDSIPWWVNFASKIDPVEMKAEPITTKAGTYFNDDQRPKVAKPKYDGKGGSKTQIFNIEKWQENKLPDYIKKYLKEL